MTAGSWRQCLVKSEFIFYLRTFQLSRSVQCTNLLVTELAQAKYVTPAFNSKKTCEKLGTAFLCSPKYAELTSHFTLLFCRGMLRNVL